MPEKQFEVEVDISMDEAWEKLRDFSAAIHYVPGLTGLEITTEEREGVGASRIVTQGRISLDETITEWRDGEGFTLRLHRGDKGPVPPMTRSWYVYSLQERDGRVFLCNRMGYELGLGIIGRWLDSLAIGKVVMNSVRDSTLSQKLYYETGKTVTPQMLQELKDRLGIDQASR